MIALDIESSSINWVTGSILSLGAVDMDHPDNRFYAECRLWDGAHVEDEALAINGFTEESIRDASKMTEAELAAAFIAWSEGVSDRTLAAQNVSFDYEYLRAACGRAHMNFPFAKRTIDVHTLGWLHMAERGITPPLAHAHSALDSKAILAYCGIPEEAKPHNALTGALWHAEVIARMAYTKNIIPEFSSYPIPWQT